MKLSLGDKVTANVRTLGMTLSTLTVSCTLHSQHLNSTDSVRRAEGSMISYRGHVRGGAELRTHMSTHTLHSGTLDSNSPQR